MTEATSRLWEKGTEELLVLRHEERERNNLSTVGLINELLLIRRERREEEERKQKERREEEEDRKQKERREEEEERKQKERREEEERRERERREIRELERLKLSKAAGTPNFSGAIDNFKACLNKVGINKPEKRVMDVLARRFPMQMTLAAECIDSAVDLYREIKDLPTTTTALQVQLQSQIYLNGPNSAENINIIIGSRSDKTPVMVKILIASGNHPRISQAIQAEAFEDEASICLQLGLATTTLPFVRSEVIDISNAQVSRKAIVMPTYVRTVAGSARLWPASLIDGSKRMIQALEHMHSKGFVHMDVKGSNIFIDQAGDWYLGDFGSTRRVGELVVSTTRCFYPDDLSGKPSMPKYDWLMLLVVILIEMLPDKNSWTKTLCESDVSIVTLPKVKSALVRAMFDAETSEQLKSLLSDIAMNAKIEDSS